VVEQDLPGLAELVSLDIELREEVGVVGYVEQRPEAYGAVVVSAAALGARGAPLAAQVLDVAVPPAAGAVGASHALPEGEKRLSTALSSYLERRGGGAWAGRILAGTLSYFPVYFFFGMLVSPFVMPYYTDSSFGLVIPPFTVIVPLEVLRGLMYVACLFPLVAALYSDRRTTAAAIIGMLFIPGALLPLLADQGLPAPIIPFHLVEILADSVVYGYILAWLLGLKKEV